MRSRDVVSWADFSTDGKRVLTSNVGYSGGEMRIWDSETGSPLTIPYRSTTARPVFGPTGRRLVVRTAPFLRVIEFPSAGVAEAKLIADLAEWLAGVQLDAGGELDPIQQVPEIEIPSKLSGSDTAKVIAMYRDMRPDRAVTPFTTTKLRDFIRQRLEVPEDDPLPDDAVTFSAIYPGGVK